MKFKTRNRTRLHRKFFAAPTCLISSGPAFMMTGHDTTITLHEQLTHAKRRKETCLKIAIALFPLLSQLKNLLAAALALGNHRKPLVNSNIHRIDQTEAKRMSGMSQDPSALVLSSSEEEKMDATPSPNDSSVAASSQNGITSTADTATTSSSQSRPRRMCGDGPDGSSKCCSQTMLCSFRMPFPCKTLLSRTQLEKIWRTMPEAQLWTKTSGSAVAHVPCKNPR